CSGTAQARFCTRRIGDSLKSNTTPSRTIMRKRARVQKRISCAAGSRAALASGPKKPQDGARGDPTGFRSTSRNRQLGNDVDVEQAIAVTGHRLEPPGLALQLSPQVAHVRFERAATPVFRAVPDPQGEIGPAHGLAVRASERAH